jgi:hypothetical protein
MLSYTAKYSAICCNATIQLLQSTAVDVLDVEYDDVDEIFTKVVNCYGRTVMAQGIKN